MHINSPGIFPKYSYLIAEHYRYVGPPAWFRGAIGVMAGRAWVVDILLKNVSVGPGRVSTTFISTEPI